MHAWLIKSTRHPDSPPGEANTENVDPSALPELLIPAEVEPQVVIIQDIYDSPDDPTCKRFYFISGDAEGFFDLPPSYTDRLSPGTQLRLRSANQPNQN